MRRLNNSAETVNAAATAIVSAENRVQQITAERRRWGSCFGAYWCFKPQKHSKRIGHAALAPEPTSQGYDAPAAENRAIPPTLALPFVAPPSSPASFLQSEPPSAIQSPVGVLSSSLAANTYSSPGPASIFAIGPYANETQLVSPPVFSTFTTEPSTAPFTPPPEPVHLTTPSSPEVPFAKLLTSSLNSNCENGAVYEFNSYQLYPGSPIGHLVSPGSVCSGTSSPLPDLDFRSFSSAFPVFPASDPPNILSTEGLKSSKLMSRHASREGGSLLDGQISAIVSGLDSATRSQNVEHGTDQRVSFELTAEHVARCMARKPFISGEAMLESGLVETGAAPVRMQCIDETGNTAALCVDETYHDLPVRARASDAAGTAKEFKFDNSDGAPSEPVIGSDWWANEKVAGPEPDPCKKWAFFPMMQPGVS